MKNKRNLLIALCAAVFVVGIAGSIWVLSSAHGSEVRISQDGKTLYTLDLDTAENQVFETKYKGRTNTIEIFDGRIRVTKAECPDQTCVETGWLENAAPIICLPNHLVIEFADTSADVDFVAQ